VVRRCAEDRDGGSETATHWADEAVFGGEDRQTDRLNAQQGKGARMPSKQEEPDPDIDFLRTFVSERARLQAEQLAGQKADQAALEEPDPARRQLAPLFEPDQSQPAPPTPPPAADRTPEPVTSFEPPRRTPWAWLLIVSALTLALGLAAGFALGSSRADEEPTSVPATRSPATQPAPAPPTSVVVQRTATSACLETARRADEIIQLFATNQRERAADLLVAYGVASRQCRRDASP
jgi:ribosomal protein S18